MRGRGVKGPFEGQLAIGCRGGYLTQEEDAPCLLCYKTSPTPRNFSESC